MRRPSLRVRCRRRSENVLYLYLREDSYSTIMLIGLNTIESVSSGNILGSGDAVPIFVGAHFADYLSA